MKFFIVLFAIVAAVSAGIIHHEPIAQPWVAPAAVVHAPLVHGPLAHGPVVHAPLPWVAPAPKYVKIDSPVAHHAKHTYHVATIQQHVPIPPPHAQPLSIKADSHSTRIHYHAPHVPHPHLVGVEHYVPAPEPGISVVKAGHGHGWD